MYILPNTNVDFLWTTRREGSTLSCLVSITGAVEGSSPWVEHGLPSLSQSARLSLISCGTQPTLLIHISCLAPVAIWGLDPWTRYPASVVPPKHYTAISLLSLNQHSPLPFLPGCHSLFPIIFTPANSDSAPNLCGPASPIVLSAVCYHCPLSALFTQAHWELGVRLSPWILMLGLNEWMNGWVNVWFVDLNSGGNHFVLPFPEHGKWMLKAICHDLPLTLDQTTACAWTAYWSAQQLLLNQKYPRERDTLSFFFANELRAVNNIEPPIKLDGYLAFKSKKSKFLGY